MWWAPLVLVIGCTAPPPSPSPTEPDAAPYRLAPAEVAALQAGDIVLRCGKGQVSRWISKHLDERYPVSHCGMVAEKEDKLYVIHAVSNSLADVDGMQAHYLQDFVADSRPGSFMAVRYKADSNARLAEVAAAYLARKLPFDHRFDRSDTTAIYCSELIWRAIIQVYQDDIFAGRLNPYSYAVFWEDTGRFEEVFNHHTQVLNSKYQSPNSKTCPENRDNDRTSNHLMFETVLKTIGFRIWCFYLLLFCQSSDSEVVAGC